MHCKQFDLHLMSGPGGDPVKKRIRAIEAGHQHGIVPGSDAETAIARLRKDAAIFAEAIQKAALASGVRYDVGRIINAVDLVSQSVDSVEQAIALSFHTGEQ